MQLTQKHTAELNFRPGSLLTTKSCVYIPTAGETLGPMTSRPPPGLPFMMPEPYFFHIYLPLLPSRNPQLRPPLCPLSKPQNCLLVSLCSKSPSNHPISCSFCIFLEILQSFKTQFKSQLLQEAFSSLPGEE